MQNPTTTLQLSALEAAVLETVVYSDVFDFPVTSEEVWRWLPAVATLDQVVDVLADDALAHYLTNARPYVMLRNREHLAAVRERRRVSSTALWLEAERYGSWIARLPFVRMVAITGSLTAGNAEDGDDLDYLIVVAPGRVWLARAMTMVVVRMVGLRGTTVCPNYLLSEAHLALRNHDLYTARELLQMQPLAGFEVYRRMLAANPWWRDYLPNAAPAAVPVETDQPSLARRVIEALLWTRPFGLLEAWLLRHKGGELRQLSTGDEAVFDETMCKGHFEGWRERSRRTLAERMTALLEGSE